MALQTPFEIASKTTENFEVRLRIKIKRDVKHFSGLASVVEGLQSLDGILRTELDEGKAIALKNSQLDARAQLLSFKVNSEPVTEFIANNSWIAVLAVAVVVVRDYEKFRSSAAVMKTDAKAFIRSIDGLTEAQKLNVVLGVNLLLDSLLLLSEQSLRGWVARLERARKALAGPDGEPPTVSIPANDA